MIIEILMIFFFTEMVILLGWYIVDSVIERYKKYNLDKELKTYESSVFAPLDEQEPNEEVFDEGYVKEVKAYEERIKQMRYELENESEIITDEQEYDKE